MKVEARAPETVSVTLAYRPPFDWEAIRGHLAARATPGVEAVGAGDGGRYARSIRLHGHCGHIAVGPGRGRRADALELRLSATLLPVLVPLLTRVRRMLDLDADPQAIAAHLGRDALLGPLVARRPGLRVPGAGDGFELALRTVLGQQVSVRGATTLAGRLALRVAEPLGESAHPADAWHPAPPSLLPVTAERLADASLASVVAIGLPRARAECVRALARAVAEGALPELTGDAPAGDPQSFVRRFTELPGIGPWTAAYVAMRALRWPDAFPEGDLVLRKAMGGLTAARLLAAAEGWRPWRAYAAQHLWASAP